MVILNTINFINYQHKYRYLKDAKENYMRDKLKINPFFANFIQYELVD